MQENKPSTPIDAYLSGLPQDRREALENLRTVILSVVPDAEEVISYQIPTFKRYGGLVGFASMKNHLSFMVMSPGLMEKLKVEVKPYKGSTATLHFTQDKPLPVDLVKNIVEERMKENEEAHQNRELKKSVKRQ